MQAPQFALDISDDELKIFLGETDEQIQVLEEGLVRLERVGPDDDLLQAMFRSAHTLKGSAGMIGHQRMATLTHAMETVLDGVRKKTVAISPALIDACLASVDVLHTLRNEIADGEYADVDIQPHLTQLTRIVEDARAARGEADPSGEPAPPLLAPAETAAPAVPPAANSSSDTLRIAADISPGTIASSARAFQLYLALQDLGSIVAMTPDLSAIESATPVRHFAAELLANKPLAEIRRALLAISEIDRLVIGEEVIDLVAKQPQGPAESDVSIDEPPRLGEFLVSRGCVTAEQVENALRRQAAGGGKPRIGLALVEMGALSRVALDEALALHLQQMRSALVSAQSATERSRNRSEEKTVRTSIERLDNLMNLVGELITDRNRLSEIRSDFSANYGGDNRVENLVQTATHIARITDQLQEEVMRIRLQPVASVLHKFPRMVRDLARQAGKQIDLVIRGEDTELDRSVIEKIDDPLIHILRNAVDHGLETPEARRAAAKPDRGVIIIAARHEESHFVLTVEDDGRGIDPDRVKASAVQKGLISEAEAAAMMRDEAIDLVFLSGLSTANEVSSLSGRGVGMDIVRTNIERLGGTVQVETWDGKGTRCQITLPLTLAIIPALLVRVGNAIQALPLGAVVETLRIDTHSIQKVHGHLAILLRDRVLPLIRMSEVFGMPASPNGKRFEFVVAVRWGKLDMGLIVDSLLGEQEMVVKSLGRLVGDTPGVSGAAILGDGGVALIIDVASLFKLVGG